MATDSQSRDIITYGHPSRSKWGLAVFGRCVPGFVAGFRLDSLVRACPDSSFSLDSLISLGPQDAAWSVESIIEALGAASFAVDAFNLRLPTDLYKLTETRPIILVELRLNGGTVRVANRPVTVGGTPYEGRLVNAGAILRTVTEGTDEVQLVLDDTDQRGPRFRDLFAVSPPEARGVSIWIALTDDPQASINRLHLFEGKIERIPGFSRSEAQLDVLRNEIVDDRLMGRLVTLTEFPLAPQEVLGAVIPIVFGTVDISPGVVINTNAVGRLRGNVFLADDFLLLLDTSDFPASGTVIVGDEQMTYSGKDDTARELTGVVRGANGTTAAEHSKDTEVREVGPFVVKFADHQVSEFGEFKITDPNGNLGEPVPGPASIDYDEATATWDELPRIRSSGVDSLFQRVHFNAQEAGNLATDPQFAGRENPGYGTFDFAKVNPSAPLKVLTNTVELGEPGDIKRVWLAIVHDSAPPSSTASLVEDGSGFVPTDDWDIAQQIVFDQIFQFIPEPDGGFTNATMTAERVRNSIRDDNVDPAIATFTELTRSVHGIPNGYNSQFATGVASLVTQAIAAEATAQAAHDANTAAAQAAALAASAGGIAQGASITFPGKTPAKFQLVAQDLTPIEIARFDDRTNDRLYDVEVQIEPPKPEEKTITPDVEIEFAGIWSNAPKVVDHQLLFTQRENAESIFDQDDNTGDATFNVPGEVLFGDGPSFACRARFLDNQEESRSSGFEVKRAYLRLWVDTVTVLGYIYAPLLAYLEGPGGKVIGSEVNCRHFNALPGETEPTVPTGCILAPEEFRSDTLPHGSGESIDIDVIGSRMENLRDLRIVIEPSPPTGDDPSQPVNCLNTWVCMTADLVVELEKEPPPDPVIDDRKGITNHFDVTDFVNGDWSFFEDAARGGSVTVESNAGELRVLEVFWVVEYAPYFDASSSVPDVFAKVTGKVPGGNPADIAESIVTSDAPQGMGLPASTSIAREFYGPAKASLAADAIRADFTITQQVRTLDLLAALADQCDYRQAWAQGKHRISRKPKLGGLLRIDGILTSIAGDALEAFSDIDDAEVLRDTLAFSRTALEDTRTRYSVRFRPLAYTDEPGGSAELINDTAEVSFGRREEQRELDLVRDQATAELVASLDLLRRAEPRWLAELHLPLIGLELALGDLVSLTHLDFSFAFGEVLDASVETLELENGPFIAVKLSMIVWQK